MSSYGEFLKRMEKAEKLTIEMTKSEGGIFYPKNVYVYLDDEKETFIRGFWVNAHVDEDIRMSISYLLTDKDVVGQRDEHGFIYRYWIQELPPKGEEIVEDDEDDIELIENDD